MEQCQSLKAVTLQNLEIDENHCRSLGAYSRPDLEIELIDCAITGAGATALAEVLGRNQGPTRARPGLIIVKFTTSSSRMGYPETAV
jgi:hypothetical protein